MLMFFFYRKVYLMKGGTISVKHKKKNNHQVVVHMQISYYK